MLDKLINWLESHMQVCFYQQHLGIECPGCGMQRAFIELLKGNIIESLKLYPALIPIILMFVYLFLHLIFKFKKGATVILILFISNTSIVILSYIYKLLTY